jgi:uncharacterized protein YcaQ
MKSTRNKNQKITLSKQEARRFILSHHFLLPPKNLSPDQILSQIFHRLGCIQFDTINVVGRNADLVLQSRIKGYRAEILNRMLYEDRMLTDGWDKVASLYNIQDWPYFSRHRKNMGNNNHLRSPEASQATTKILQQIEANGPVSSLDFKDTPKTDWSWGPTSVTRAALEILYAEGKLGIHHRVNTRRHFDLIERLIPSTILKKSDPNTTDEEYEEWHVLRRIGGVGIASPKSGEHWLGIYGGRKVSERNTILSRLLKKEKITQVWIEGLGDQVFYLRTADLPKLNSPIKDNSPKGTAFLAPLDNLLWNRKLINDLFDFKYIWEVYKPKEKREYGYYVLPVLYGEQFIARVDMKFDRKMKTLNLINWWWEPKIEQDAEMVSSIQNCMQDFFHYLGAETFNIISDNLQSSETTQIFQSIN